MTMIGELGRSIGTAAPIVAIPGIADRARAEAERRTVGRRGAPGLVSATYRCAGCGTLRVLASAAWPGVCEACGARMEVLAG
jgi:hypothetical protein